MKVLTFPSEDFSRDDLDKMSDNELWDLSNRYKYECEQYWSEKAFQNAFNNGNVSDETFIYFID